MSAPLFAVTSHTLNSVSVTPVLLNSTCFGHSLGTVGGDGGEELEEAVVAARLVEHARDALHEDDARQHAAQGEAHAGEPQAGLGPLPASLGFEASAAYRQENMKT